MQLDLIAGEGLASPARERLATVQEELARIASIAQSLLDFQRPTPGQRTLCRVPELLEDVLVLASKQLQQHGVTVVHQGDSDLKPVLVVGGQIKRVFLNLVLNAVEAMPGGGQLRVNAQQVIMLTGHGTLESAMTAVKAGAHDYLLKLDSGRPMS